MTNSIPLNDFVHLRVPMREASVEAISEYRGLITLSRETSHPGPANEPRDLEMRPPQAAGNSANLVSCAPLTRPHSVTSETKHRREQTQSRSSMDFSK
jgi:hypothetical protein